jgi:hypothetical protein
MPIATTLERKGEGRRGRRWGWKLQMTQKRFKNN